MKRSPSLLFLEICLVLSLMSEPLPAAPPDLGRRPVVVTSGADADSGPLAGVPFFGMEVLSVEEASNRLTVTTTGAKYVLTRDGMEMWRRIDPATNTVKPRKVATLSFASNIGPVRVTDKSRRKVTVASDVAKFTFHSDSLILIASQSGAFQYKHTNLIEDADWVKTDPENNCNRMWASAHGGSLHAQVEGPVSHGAGKQLTTLTLERKTAKMGHMVFPPKPYDFEALYGSQARPFVAFVFYKDQANNIMKNATYVRSRHIGTVLLWNWWYLGDGTEEWQDGNKYKPYPLQRKGPYQGKIGYEFRDPVGTQKLIDDLHANGFKVSLYFSGGCCGRWGNQSMDLTLEWMGWFTKKHHIDGWYFDNANYRGGGCGGWYSTYDFIRGVREIVGDEGLIYHHDSVDVLGGYSGLRAVMVDAYANWTLTGETGPLAEAVDDPNNPYLRYYVSNYGLSQAFGSFIRTTRRTAAIAYSEERRVAAQNLHCHARVVGSIAHFDDMGFESDCLPAHERKRREYANGTLKVNVTWPVKDWFRGPTGVEVKAAGPTSVNIKWETNEKADGRVAWTKSVFPPPIPERDLQWDRYVWWDQGPDDPIINNQEVRDNTLTKEHKLTVTGLKPGIRYEFRIRSSNGEVGADEVIWGCVTSFTIPLQDQTGEDM